MIGRRGADTKQTVYMGATADAIALNYTAMSGVRSTSSDTTSNAPSPSM